MSDNYPDWLEVIPGSAPLIVSIPHSGTEIPTDLLPRLHSLWLARKDTDWYVDRLYHFATSLGATVLRTRVSRTVIDVNRDPTGASLYPGQPTTELCPSSTFDGESLYRAGFEPKAEEIVARRLNWFDPYHAALVAEIGRLRGDHLCVIVYDCHSIRSVVPRLFDGHLPHFNIGTNSGRSCDSILTRAIEEVVAQSGFTQVTNGRFRGGYITRQHGRPTDGIHAVQMELAIRGYLVEPVGSLEEANWPPEYNEAMASPFQTILHRVLLACLVFARSEHKAEHH